MQSRQQSSVIAGSHCSGSLDQPSRTTRRTLRVFSMEISSDSSKKTNPDSLNRQSNPSGNTSSQEKKDPISPKNASVCKAQNADGFIRSKELERKPIPTPFHGHIKQSSQTSRLRRHPSPLGHFSLRGSVNMQLYSAKTVQWCIAVQLQKCSPISNLYRNQNLPQHQKAHKYANPARHRVTQLCDALTRNHPVRTSKSPTPTTHRQSHPRSTTG